MKIRPYKIEIIKIFMIDIPQSDITKINRYT